MDQNNVQNPGSIVQQNQPQFSNKTTNSIIAIFLLLFLFPVGLIYMWIAAPWSKAFKWVLTFIFVILPIGLAITLAALNAKKSTVPSSAPINSQDIHEYSSYQATSININFSFPKGWVVQDESGTIIIASKEVEGAYGRSLENAIYIRKFGDKPVSTPLLNYVIDQSHQPNSIAKDSDFIDLGKTSQGYELVEFTPTHDYHISNGTSVLLIQPPLLEGLDKAIVDKIINSIVFR